MTAAANSGVKPSLTLLCEMLAAAGISLLALGCSPVYEKVMEAEYISMVTTTPPVKPLSNGRKISVSWCTNEDPLSPGIGDGEVGMVDQVVLRANRKYKTPYIVHPSLVWERRSAFQADCIHLKGYLPKGA